MTFKLKEKYRLAVEIAREAGEKLVENLGKTTEAQIEEKSNRTDLVTDMDKIIQQFIIHSLNDQYPSFGVIAEEDYREEKKSNWIIDPIDGTTNYAIEYPMFCISIALESSGDVEFGVVHVPLLKETFTAVEGKGAWLNGKPISVSLNDDFSRSVLATGFPYETSKVSRALTYFNRLVRKTRGVRRDGSAAIDLCYVAKGRFDGFWELGLNTWDVAAGSLIVREAGGKVSTMENEQFDHASFDDIVATNGIIHGDLIRNLKLS